MIALPAGHPLEALDIIRPKHLDGQPFIALAPEDMVRRQVDDIFEKEGARPKLVLETPYSTTICAMVQAGIGIGMVNPLIAEPYLGNGLSLRSFEPAIHFRTPLLLPPNRKPSLIVGDFIEELLKFSTVER